MIRRSWPGISPEKVDLESGVLIRIRSTVPERRLRVSIAYIYYLSGNCQYNVCIVHGSKVTEFLRTSRAQNIFRCRLGRQPGCRGGEKKAKKNSTGLISTDCSGCLEIMHGRIGSFGALARTLHWNFPQEHLFSSPKFRDVKRNPEAVHDAFR
jgi:hypothetical protein